MSGWVQNTVDKMKKAGVPMWGILGFLIALVMVLGFTLKSC